MASYQPRIVDDELDELIPGLPAIAIEGPKAVGKTETALRRAVTVHRLDDSGTREVVSADPRRLAAGPYPVLIDEWQRLPESWDVVRRAVDENSVPGRFLLTGSASPIEAPTHSGAGRIVTVRMRPMALSERLLDPPTVSMAALLSGTRPPIEGGTSVTLIDYVDEILHSGFPGIRQRRGRAMRAELDGYVDRIVEREFDDLGYRVRNPGMLRRWLMAYAAASSTNASYERIRDAASSGEGNQLARSTTAPYRAALERLWMLDPVPAWGPGGTRLRRLMAAPVHQLADPALAAALLGVDADALLDARPTGIAVAKDGTLLGALFESLVTLSVRTYAQVSEARVSQLRTRGGAHEVDLIVERRDGRVLAIEVKLASSITGEHVRHLHWLRETVGPDLLDAVVVSTGREAYRRADGIAVVPAALLGP